MEEAISGLSGGISGIFATLVWYPLETIRIRLQQEYLDEDDVKHPEHNKNEKKKSTSVNSLLNDNISEINNTNKEKILKIIEEDNSIFSQSMNFFKRVLKEEGFASLYNGMSSALIGSMQSYSVYFYAYKFWQNFFIRNNLSSNVIYDTLWTSFLGAVCTSVLTNPIWVLNSRMIQSKQKVK